MLTKSQQLLLYLMTLKDGKVDDKTKLAKYQYFADFIHYAFHSCPVSQEGVLYTRQKQGPLAHSLTEDLDRLKELGYIKESPSYQYSLVKEPELSLSEGEKRTARYVINKYGKLSYSDLVRVCHVQTPYLSAQDGGVIEFFTAYNLVDEYGDYVSFKS